MFPIVTQTEPFPDHRTSSRTVINAQRALEAKLGNHGCTEQGMAWVVEAVDPFHDGDTTADDGFPDGTGLASNILRVNKDVQISAPAGLSSSTWDAQIVLFPWVDNVNVFPGEIFQATTTATPPVSAFTPVVLSTNVSPIGFAPLTVWTGNNGMNPLLDSPSTITTNRVFPDASFIANNQRLIAVAFEVRSVGPELYKSGTGYMWRQPTADPLQVSTASVITANFSTGASVASNDCNVVVMPKIPTTTGEVIQIPSTVTVMARQGGYVVGRLNTTDPSTFDIAGVTPVMLAGGSATSTVTGLAGIAGQTCYTPNSFLLTVKPGGMGAGFSNPSTTTTRFTNFDVTGMYLTGLNPQDTLNIKVRWIVQRYPTIADNILNVLSRASPRYDPCAIEAYAKIMSQLPVGCPVSENGLGSWFKSAASAIGSVAKQAAPMVLAASGPKGKALSAGMTAIKGLLGKEDKKLDKVEKQISNLKLEKTNKKK
jgi:hypothetical protein